MRGAASAADARFVAALARKLQLPFAQRRLKLSGNTSEDAARRARLLALATMARAHRCQAVVMAHHADDQAETILMRIFRGCGIDGLAAMSDLAVLDLQDTPSRRGRGHVSLQILRPLLDVRRAQLLDFLKSSGQSWCNDATNNTPRYLRNRVRAQLLPVIESLWPQAVPALCRLARLAGETQEVIAAKSSRLLPPDPRPGARRIALSRPKLRHADPAIASHALRRVIESMGGSVESSGFQRLAEALRLIRYRAGGKRIEMGRGLSIVLKGDTVEVTRAKPLSRAPRRGKS